MPVVTVQEVRTCNDTRCMEFSIGPTVIMWSQRTYMHMAVLWKSHMQASTYVEKGNEGTQGVKVVDKERQACAFSFILILC